VAGRDALFAIRDALVELGLMIWEQVCLGRMLVNSIEGDGGSGHLGFSIAQVRSG